MEPTVLDRIAPDVKVSVERVTFPALVAVGSLFALADESYWLDTGTPQAYLEAHRDVLEGHRHLELATPIRDGNWIHPAARVSDAQLTLASVDRDVVVEDGATIENSVIMPGATIADRKSTRLNSSHT